MPVVLGALIVIGRRAAAIAEQRKLALEFLVELPTTIFRAADCPMCGLGTPLTEP